jgi:hypothetical protein
MSRKYKLLACAALAFLVAGLIGLVWLTRSPAPVGSPYCAGAAQAANRGRAVQISNCAACHQQDRLQELVAKVRSLVTKTRPAAACPGAAQPASIGSKSCTACHRGASGELGIEQE